MKENKRENKERTEQFFLRYLWTGTLAALWACPPPLAPTSVVPCGHLLPSWTPGWLLDWSFWSLTVTRCVLSAKTSPLQGKATRVGIQALSHANDGNVFTKNILEGNLAIWNRVAKVQCYPQSTGQQRVRYNLAAKQQNSLCDLDQGAKLLWVSVPSSVKMEMTVVPIL